MYGATLEGVRVCDTLLYVLGETLAGHSYDDVDGCSIGTLLPLNVTSSLVGMVVAPQYQIHFVFLEW